MAAEPVISFGPPQQLEDLDPFFDFAGFCSALEITYAELCILLEARATRPLRQTAPRLSPPGGVRRTWPGLSYLQARLFYFRRLRLRRRLFPTAPAPQQTGFF